jgi:hypothetical protein
MLGFSKETPRSCDMKSWLFCAVLGVASLPASVDDTWNELRKKADAGDVRAQIGLGLRYHHGEGAAVDLPLAVAWYRKDSSSAREVDVAVELLEALLDARSN